jgi:hypothetical protein
MIVFPQVSSIQLTASPSCGFKCSRFWLTLATRLNTAAPTLVVLLEQFISAFSSDEGRAITVHLHERRDRAPDVQFFHVVKLPPPAERATLVCREGAGGFLRSPRRRSISMDVACASPQNAVRALPFHYAPPHIRPARRIDRRPTPPASEPVDVGHLLPLPAP